LDQNSKEGGNDDAVSSAFGAAGGTKKLVAVATAPTQRSSDAWAASGEAMVATESQSKEEPLSKEEALKRFLARKAAGEKAVEAAPASPTKRAIDDEPAEDPDKNKTADLHAQDTASDAAKHRDLKKIKHRESSFPVSSKSHFDLVPGHQNTTTKEPMRRPPDVRLVTAMASKGKTLAETMSAMNMGPSGRRSALQTLTTRDVVMIPDLFEPNSGFVMPPDPWDAGDGTSKTIYQRLVEEIHIAGQHESRGGGGGGGNGKFVDKCFSTGSDGVFKEDANGLFKAWCAENSHELPTLARNARTTSPETVTRRHESRKSPMVILVWLLTHAPRGGGQAQDHYAGRRRRTGGRPRWQRPPYRER
jgi:hypothetical protein